MTTTYLDASDDMKATATAAWNAATLAVLGSSAKMLYQDRIKAGAVEVGTPDEYWARTVVQHVTTPQVTLGGPADGSRRHTAHGLLWVQMFFPLAKTVAWRNGQKIASAVKNALAKESVSGTVWFLNARINDNLPADTTHHRLNVLVEFQYDEII